MVYLLASIIFFSSLAQASQMDTFFGPAEPAYVKAIAPRFSKWVLDNFEAVPASGRKPWKELLLQETAQMTEWSFSPFKDFSWPRLQFGLRFAKGSNTDAYVFFFPKDSEDSLRKIQKFFPLPKEHLKGWIGYGISLREDKVYIFNREEKRVRQTAFVNGKWLKSNYLSLGEEPPETPFSFVPLVTSWGIWSDAEGRFLQYELTLDKFNLRILDGAAIGVARRVNSEFLLNNLRITYRAVDDYDVLYP